MSYPHDGLRTGRLGPPSTVQASHLRCGLVDAATQVGPLVLRRGAMVRLRCASAGCPLLRHSLSASIDIINKEQSYCEYDF